MRNYLQHGTRHVPSGTDAIPFSSLPWAYINGDGSSHNCAPSSTTRLAADSSTFYTNAPGYFGAGSTSGVEGIKLLANGHYHFTICAIPTTAVAVGDSYEIIAEGGGQAPDFFSGQPQVYSPDAAAVLGVNVAGLMSVGDFIAAPTDAIVCRIDTGSNSGHTLHIEYFGLMVVQLDGVVQDLN